MLPDVYAQRLAALTAKYLAYDGMRLDYMVYLDSKVNADSTPDGSVRVNSGIMDLVTDDELMFLLGHGIGHVKLGHSGKTFRRALTASGFKQTAGVVGGGGALAGA